MRFAVHRPGIPGTSPRSHGVLRRDVNTLATTTDISGEVKRRFLHGLKAEVSTLRSR